MFETRLLVRGVMNVRRADLSDAAAVQRISADAYTRAYQAICGFVPKPALEDYRPRIQGGEVWILETDGHPAGVAVLEERSDHLLVYSIAVTPSDQRKGLGAALLRFADERATADRRERPSTIVFSPLAASPPDDIHV